MIDRNEEELLRPWLILAHPDLRFVALALRQLCARGWDVTVAPTGAEARRLAALRTPCAVVLGTDLQGESGWLVCEKLSWEHPGLRVILVGSEGRVLDHDFAEFVGASRLIARQEGIPALAEELADACLPVAT